MLRRLQALFKSKNFFTANVALAGAIVGFAVAFTLLAALPRPQTGALAPASRGEALGVPVSVQGEVGMIPASFRSVAAAVLPTVVEIKVVDIVKEQVPSFGQGFPWNFFFQGPGQGNAPQTQEFKQEGLGSGVIVHRAGDTVYVLTNNHVAGDASQIEVVLYDKRQFKAKLVGKDPRLDLALVSFVTGDRNIPVATLGDSSQMQVGDWVLAVGNPYGYMSTVTAGIVSALGREGEGPGNTVARYIQTDAAINKGNSGGALVNLEGQVVGINSWIASPQGGSVGLGFAIAINDAKRAITDFINHGSVQYGWLGASVQDPYPTLAAQMGLDGKQGSMIYHIFLNSPADKGGLKPGDYVTAINGVRVTDTEELLRLVGDLPIGRDATFSVIRYGEPKKLTVRVALRESDQKLSANHNLWPGFEVVPIDATVRSQLNLDSATKGLVVSDVIGQTQAAIAGIQQGDIVRAINGTPVNNALDFYRAIGASRGTFNFKLDRQGTTVNIGIGR